MSTDMNTLVMRYVKTIAGFVTPIILNMITDLINGNSPWPQTGAEWTRYLVTSFGTALVVALSPANRITQKQLDKDPGIPPGTVVVPPSDANVVKSDDPPPSAGGYSPSWSNPT